MSSIKEWLDGLGLADYATIFADNAVDYDVLPDLTEADLAHIGIPLGHRKKMLRAIKAIARPSEPSPAHVEPSQDDSGAERRHLTVMFCDLVGFTTLSQQIDPEDLGYVVHAYQDCCAGIVARQEGFTARYLGDGILVYFGFPRAHEDDAERAVMAGLEIVEAVQHLRPHGDIVLQTRVGIATGLVVVGDLTTVGEVHEYSVVGKTPNVAARLQALAEPDSVVIEQSTLRLVEGLFDCRDLGAHTIKGISEPIQVWHVCGEKAPENRFQARHGGHFSPLVGREQENALLVDRWERARDGEGQVVLVSGEPGIGKSRMIQAFEEQLSGLPHGSLRYNGSPHHEASALHPFLEQMSRSAGLARDDSTAAQLGKLEALLSETTDDAAAAARQVAAMMSIPGIEPPSDQELAQDVKEQTLEVFAQQIDVLSRKRPLLVVVEDAQWLDPTSLELLDLIVSSAHRQQLLLAITLRSEFISPLQRHPRVTLLKLTRLRHQQCEAIVQHIAGSKDLPDELLKEIIARTDGVPLFVEELTKAVLETDIVTEQGDSYALTGKTAALSIPTTLHGTLLARLERFPGAKEVAQTGAAIGREFSHDMLAALSPIPTPALETAIEHLVESEILYQGGRPPQSAYRFKHALVQDTAYETLLRSRRQALHRRIAALLETRYPETADQEPELLAHHFSHAGQPAMAIGYRLKAGNAAIGHSALLEAINQLNLGLELLGQLPEADETRRLELQLQVAMGSALRASAGTGAPETGAAWHRAAKLCLDDQDAPYLLRALYGQFLFHHVNGKLKQARDLGGELVTLGRRLDDTRALLRGYSAVGRVAFALGDLIDARAHLEQALDLGQDFAQKDAPAASQPMSPVLDLAYLSWTLFNLGYPDRALTCCEESIAVAQEFAQPYDQVLALGNACYLHQFRRDAAAVLDCAEQVIALANEHGFPAWLSLGFIFRGWALVQSDRCDPGIALIRQGLADHRAAGEELEVPYFLGLLAESCARAGRPSEGLELVDEALDLVENTGERWFEAELHHIKGKLLGAIDPPQAAAGEESLRHALKVAREQNARMLELRAATSLFRLLRDRDARDEADALLAPTLGWFDAAAEAHDLEEARDLLRDVADPSAARAQ